ncbi:MAG: methyltransferase domain-containing protein [Treponema sp.]|nr:methyltransferase domain-containing protein [Treponema sp.]
MESIKNLVEYYDELYPVTLAQQTFYETLIQKYSSPAKILSIGCGTGVLCHRLAKDAVDVTGLEPQRELLESASLKYRNQLMSLRYFQMSTLEMTRFLGKKFYNIISCLNSRVIFIHDQTLIRKFFFDCKELLADGGKLILQLFNFDKYQASTKIYLPELSSARVKYKSVISRNQDGTFYLDSFLEKNNKNTSVYEQAKIYPLKKSEIEDFSKEAGFRSVQFFSGYDGLSFYEDSDYMLAVLD